jgi:mxaJ protein
MPMKRRTVVIPLAVSALWFVAAPTRADALRVCADPDYLPYSNRAGEGFENKIAKTVAKALGETVEYTWASTRGHGGFTQFLSTTIDAKKCDVVMSIPYGSRDELTTRPYYISSYVFIFEKAKNYGITSMDSPGLKRLKIGFERDTPAEEAVKLRGLIPQAMAFDVAGNPEQSPEDMLRALRTGKIEVLVTWQPAVGAFLRRYPQMEVVAVPNARTLGAPEQYSFPMSMAVRTGDPALKKRLDDVIEKHQGELSSVLSQNGVTLYTPREK